MRQNAQVQHIGIGNDDARLVADGGAVTLRRVAVVGTQRERRLQRADPLFQRRDLIMRERLGGEEQQRRRRGIAHERVEQRQRVAERFTGRRSGSEDDVLAAQRGGDSALLVCVQRVNAQPTPDLGEAWIQIRGPCRRLRRSPWQNLPCRHIADKVPVRA